GLGPLCGVAILRHHCAERARRADHAGAARPGAEDGRAMRLVTITLAAAGLAISFRWPLIGAVLIAPMLIATFRPNVEWLGPVISRFNTDRNEVWLTIDDGPTDDTTALLHL